MLKMKGITKTFPGVKALENVDFEVGSGEVHALIGANGAGKSTLMKVLAGAYGGYEGDIFINNRKVTINNPIDAKHSLSRSRYCAGSTFDGSGEYNDGLYHSAKKCLYELEKN